jgi:hypothetical protein
LASDPVLAAKRAANDADLDAQILAGWDAAMGEGGKASLDKGIRETESRVLKKDVASSADDDDGDDESQVSAASDAESAAAAAEDESEPHDADLDPETSKAQAAEAKAREEAGGEETPKTEPESKKPDPQVLKRLEQLNRQEQRNKAAASVRMQEIQRREAELEQRTAAVQRFDVIKERAKFDPVGVLSELIGEASAEDYDAIAQQFFAVGSAGAKDPRIRAKAAEVMQGRQTHSETQRLKREIDEMRAERERERNELQLERYKTGLASRAQKAISDKAPIMRALFASDPDEARELIYAVANDMYQTTGEEPDVGDVIASLEQWKRSELKKFGIDPDLLNKKTETLVAGEKKTAKKTLTNAMTNPKAPKKPTPPEDDDELDAETIRALESGQFDGLV